MIAAFTPIQKLTATVGDVDPTFGNGGVATPSSSTVGYAYSVALQLDGQIVALGSQATVLRLARFTTNGVLDPTFGSGGTVFFDAGADESPLKVLIRPNGRILALASLPSGRLVAAQYNADGTMDASFGAGGVATDNSSHNIWQITDAALQADGSLLVVGHGYFGTVDHLDFTIMRFTPAGIVDASFGDNGLVRTGIFGADEAFAVSVLPDDRFVVAGFSDTGAGLPRHFAFFRYLPDGALDTSFGAGGKVAVDPAPGVNRQAWAYDVLVQPDGTIVGAGFTQTDFTAHAAVVRLHSDGQLDTSFSGDGRATFDVPLSPLGHGNFGGGFGRIALQSTGRLLGIGTDSVFGIRTDGTLDPDFHLDGAARIPALAYDMVVQEDDKAVVAGGPNLTNQPGFRVLRLVAQNTPPLLTPSAVTLQRGTSTFVTLGTASDTSDPIANLVVAPVAGTVPAGLTFTSFFINPNTGVVSAAVSAACTTATGTFDVQFSITDGGNVRTFATVPLTVVQNPAPALSLGDRIVFEGDDLPFSAVLTLTATGTVCAPVTVNYSTADGTAVAPGDYTPASGTVTLAAGQSSTTITVTTLGDLLPENDETLFVNLDTPVNATIADGQGVVTIFNDEPSLVQFAGVTAIDVLETDTPSPGQIVTLKLVRLTGLRVSSVVRMTFAGATYGSDFAYPADNPDVRFNQGQTEAEFRVIIVGDLADEDTETLILTLTGGRSLNSVIGTPSTAVITIRDNDGGPSDPDAPVVIGSIPIAPNAAGWHKADLAVALSATDGTGSGVKSISYAVTGAQPQALTTVASATALIPIVNEGISLVTFFAEDIAGNVAASQSLTVRLDKTAPGVVITSPEARTYTVNEPATAAYACADTGSGIAACTGTAAPGAAIDTSSPGARTFTATATDAAGNTATASVAYSVVMPPPTFTIRALYDPLREHNSGSAIPIKLQVENAAGLNISASGLALEALAVSSGTEIGPAEEELLADDAGQSNPLGRFRFVSDGTYLFNLKTKGLTPGPYVLVVRVAGDTALHAVPFLIREP